jgi:coproporphyrinogen III oxidase
VFHRTTVVPTVHMNVRMIAAKPLDGSAPVCWDWRRDGLDALLRL